AVSSVARVGERLMGRSAGSGSGTRMGPRCCARPLMISAAAASGYHSARLYPWRPEVGATVRHAGVRAVYAHTAVNHVTSGLWGGFTVVRRGSVGAAFPRNNHRPPNSWSESPNAPPRGPRGLPRRRHAAEPAVRTGGPREAGRPRRPGAQHWA